MYISNKKRKYILRESKQKSPQVLASETGLPLSEVIGILAEKGLQVRQNEKITAESAAFDEQGTLPFKILIIGLILAPLFFISGLYDMYSLPKYSLLIVFYPLAAILWLGKSTSSGKINYYKMFGFPFLPLLLFVALSLLSFLWSINNYENFYQIQIWICALVIFFIYSNYFSNVKQLEIIGAVIAFTATTISILGIFQFFGYNPDFLYQAAVPGTTFGNKNFATQYIIAAWPFSIFTAYSFRKNKIGVISALSSFIILYFILITRTRSAWVSTALSIFMSIILFVVYLRKRNISFIDTIILARKSFLKFFLPGLLFLIIFIYKIFMPSDIPEKVEMDIGDELKSITETEKGSAHWRISAWANTLVMIKSNFVKGIGIGNWEFNYPLYARKAIIDKDFNEKRQAKRAHNDYLQIAAELGIGGISFFLWFLINILYISLKLFFKDIEQSWNLLGITVFLSVISVMCDAFFNFPMQESLPPFMLAVFGSMVTYGHFRKTERVSPVYFSKAISWIAFIVFALILSINVVWAYKLCSADYYFLEGKRLNKSENYEASILPLKKSMRLNPYNFRTYSLLGRTYNELKMYYDSVPINKKALELHPNYINCMNNLGNALRGIHHPDEAIEVYNRALKLYPDFAEAYNNLGIAYKEKGDTESAKKMYLKAVKLDDKYEKAFNNLGNIYLAEDNVEEAIKYYKKTIEINPNLADVYNNYGLALNKKGEYQKAIELFDKCISLTNRLPDPYNNKGTALKALGKLDDAIIQFDKALVVNNRYLPAINNLAETYIEQNKLDLASENYEKLLQIDPNIKSIYQVLAELYLKMYNEKKTGQYIDNAVRVIESGLSFFPNNPNFLTILGKIYIDSGQSEKAIDTFKKVVELDPNKAESYYNLGIVYHQNKKFDFAIENYKHALSLNPDFLFLHLELGKIYEATGKYKDAAISYKVFIDKWKGDQKYTDSAKQKLQQLLNSGAVK